MKTVRPSHALGREAEALAGEYLAAQGYRLVGRNLRYRGGELDLVAWDRGVLVFVEVKGRGPQSTHLPQEAVDQRKRNRLVAAAEAHLAALDGAVPPCRFDVVAVDFAPESPALTHLKDAFRPGE